MDRSLIRVLRIGCPDSLVEFLLVGGETVEDYAKFFGAIVAGLNPVDAINWLYTRDVVDLAWQIRRERAVSVSIIKLKQKEVVRDHLKATVDASEPVKAAAYRIFSAANEAESWASDAASRKEIGARLAARGHPPSAVLAEAYTRGARHIDAIDKRIASYEVRKVAIVREIERRDAMLARDLAAASSEAIDAEFSEAAE